MAAPLGNQHAAKDKQWARAIEAALDRRSRVDRVEALAELAEQLLKKCDGGDIGALKELGDRLDGKPKQQTEISGPDGGPVQGNLTVELVRSGSDTGEA